MARSSLRSLDRSAAPRAHTAAGAAFTQLVIEVFRLNGVLIAVGDGMTKDLGLTSARWQVLGAIGKAPKTVAEAARQMGLTRQNVQRIADWLVENGIAEFVDNPNHRRAKLVALTRKGMALRDRLGERQGKWANETGAQTTTAELAAAADVLRRLRAVLDEEG
jgi:DNA-binding MarR family transcriptional regulator